MKLLKSGPISILVLFLLVGCNLNSPSGTPPAVISPTLPATGVPSTVAVPSTTLPPTATSKPPTQSVTSTFPAVITATPLPATATSAATPRPTVVPTKATPVKITQIHMVDMNSGWAIGQYTNATTDDILRTSDGGKTWKTVTPPEPNRPGKHAVAFFQDGAHAWVNFTGLSANNNPPTSFTIWRTTDSGATWKSSSNTMAGISNMEGFYTTQMAFRDANNGWLMSILGAGMSHSYIAIYKTSDGGATWTLIVSPDKDNVPMGCGKSGLWFRDATHGLLAGDCGGVMKGLYLYQTSDGGATWSLVNLPAPAGLADAFTRDGNACGADAPQFFDAQNGVLVVQCTDYNSSKYFRWVYVTKNGGASWTSSPLPRAWGGIFFLNVSTGWYLGQTAPDVTTGVNVYQTTDSGANWKQISGTQWGGTLDYIDAKNGWVIVKSGVDTALVRTVDGGLSYQMLNPQLAP